MQQSQTTTQHKSADNQHGASGTNASRSLPAVPVLQKVAPKEELLQKKPNNTGLPDNLKSGIENLSGYSMDDVKVHYNSSKPAQLQALAYAQGTDIHVAPGQELHLPHEAWHVVQQKQGRVQPTMQMKERGDGNGNNVVQLIKINQTSEDVDYSEYDYNQLVKLAHDLRSDRIMKFENTGTPKYEFTDEEFEAVHLALKQKELTEEKVAIKEAYATRVSKDQEIVYPGIDSCVAITLYLNTGFKAGVHMVMTQSPIFAGPVMIEKLKGLIGKDETVVSACVDYNSELGWDDKYRNMMNDGYDGNTDVSKFTEAVKKEFKTDKVITDKAGGNVIRK